MRWYEAVITFLILCGLLFGVFFLISMWLRINNLEANQMGIMMVLIEPEKEPNWAPVKE